MRIPTVTWCWFVGLTSPNPRLRDGCQLDRAVPPSPPECDASRNHTAGSLADTRSLLRGTRSLHSKAYQHMLGASGMHADREWRLREGTIKPELTYTIYTWW